MATCRLLQKFASVGILLSSVAVSVSAQDAPAENDYYQMDSFKLPEGLVLEIGGIEWFNEKLAISTRRGDIYMVENALTKEIGDAATKIQSASRQRAARRQMEERQAERQQRGQARWVWA